MILMEELEHEQKLIAKSKARLNVLNIAIKVKCRECKNVEMQIFTILSATYVLKLKA